MFLSMTIPVRLHDDSHPITLTIKLPDSLPLRPSQESEMHERLQNELEKLDNVGRVSHLRSNKYLIELKDGSAVDATLEGVKSTIQKVVNDAFADTIEISFSRQ